MGSVTLQPEFRIHVEEFHRDDVTDKTLFSASTNQVADGDVSRDWDSPYRYSVDGDVIESGFSAVSSFDANDVTEDESHDSAAMFVSHDVDVLTAPDELTLPPASGECLNPDSVVFYTPAVEHAPSIAVLNSCIDGSCKCCHLIGDVPSQLKPCRAAQFLFGQHVLTTVSEEDKSFLWLGLVNGFKIVDEDCPAEYSCANYDSITSPEFKDEMSALLLSERHTKFLRLLPPLVVSTLWGQSRSRMAASGLLQTAQDLKVLLSTIIW